MNWKNILIVVVIILLGVFAWSIWGGDDEPNNGVTFTAEGNLTQNNPGQESGVWYLIYEEPGRPALSVRLNMDNVNEGTLTQGQRVRVTGTQVDNIVTVTSITPTSTNNNNLTVELYYYNPDLDQGPGGVQCTDEGLVAVSRTIPATETPLQDTIRLLLRGELSTEERAEGIETEFPLAGFTLSSASIQNGVATLTFNDPQNRTSGGSCRVSILRAQIIATAEQFESVNSVRILPEEIFQP